MMAGEHSRVLASLLLRGPRLIAALAQEHIEGATRLGSSILVTKRGLPQRLQGGSGGHFHKSNLRKPMFVPSASAGGGIVSSRRMSYIRPRRTVASTESTIEI